MFYCTKCAFELEWPLSISNSYGPCECCGLVGTCNDLPSRLLPMPESKSEE